MAEVDGLVWHALTPDLWISEDKLYLIVRSVPVPFDHTVVFTLRKRDPAMAKANPATPGYFVAERYSLTEAQGAAALPPIPCH